MTHILVIIECSLVIVIFPSCTPSLTRLAFPHIGRGYKLQHLHTVFQVVLLHWECTPMYLNTVQIERSSKRRGDMSLTTQAGLRTFKKNLVNHRVYTLNKSRNDSTKSKKYPTNAGQISLKRLSRG